MTHATSLTSRLLSSFHKSTLPLQSYLPQVFRNGISKDWSWNWPWIGDCELARLLAEVSRYAWGRRRRLEEGIRRLLDQGLAEAGRRGLLPADEDTFRVEVDQALTAGTLQVETDPPHTLVSLWAASRWPGCLEDKETLLGSVEWLVTEKLAALDARNGAQPVAAERCLVFDSAGPQAERSEPDGQACIEACPICNLSHPQECLEAPPPPLHQPIGPVLARRLDRRRSR